jgi:hypothetical protein
MMLEHPGLGVGLDNFGDWYRRSRTQDAADFNAGLVANSAHSIPLDLAASGGVPLLLLYLTILGLALVSIARVVHRSSKFDVAFASIVAAWVAYQAQSVISINQIGLGVWGWSLTGLLIGYEYNTRNQEPLKKASKENKRVQHVEKLSASSLLITVAAGAVGLAISLPPLFAANAFKSAIQSGSVELIKEGAYLNPYDQSRFLFSARILASEKLDSVAIEVLTDAVKIYPDHFELWQQWSQIPTATPAQIAKAKSEMKRLDPFNRALK